jgi:hypothetical protein
MSCLLASAAAATLSVESVAAPTATFLPSPSSTEQHFAPKATADGIQILPGAPAGNVVIIGELSIDGGAGAPLHLLMNAALNEAMNRGADFLALSGADSRSIALGKMVPAGHGRSMFVAGPVLGSEVGRIAAIPAGGIASIRMVLGRFSTGSS